MAIGSSRSPSIPLTLFRKVAIFSILVLSTMRLTGTQSGLSDDSPDGNVTNSSTLLCPVIGLPCDRLTNYDLCVSCNFTEAKESCRYGDNVTVTCYPQEGVNCTGDTTFNRTFVCRYCYQLPDDLQCCEPNDTCQVRGTPSSKYVAHCRAPEDVLCIEPREFQRQRECNYSKGKRWTTAFLLSITLGGFGVDRFYLEHWGSAVGKFLSFGGLGVWSILDVILVGTGYLGPADGSSYIY